MDKQLGKSITAGTKKETLTQKYADALYYINIAIFIHVTYLLSLCWKLWKFLAFIMFILKYLDMSHGKVLDSINEYKIVIISMEEHRYIYIYVPIAYKLSPLFLEFLLMSYQMQISRS